MQDALMLPTAPLLFPLPPFETPGEIAVFLGLHAWLRDRGLPPSYLELLDHSMLKERTYNRAVKRLLAADWVRLYNRYDAL